jgi:copper chaperone CopZ
VKKTFHYGPPLLPVWLGRRLLMPILLASLAFIGSPSMGNGVSSERIDLTINGMVCSFCVEGVERKIRGLPATQNVKIDLSKRIVQVWVRPGETIQDDQLRKLIRDAGFDVREIKHIKLSP